MKRFNREATIREVAKLEPWLAVIGAVESSRLDLLEPHRLKLAVLLAGIMDRVGEEIGAVLGMEIRLCP